METFLLELVVGYVLVWYAKRQRQAKVVENVADYDEVKKERESLKEGEVVPVHIWEMSGENITLIQGTVQDKTADKEAKIKLEEFLAKNGYSTNSRYVIRVPNSGDFKGIPVLKNQASQTIAVWSSSISQWLNMKEYWTFRKAADTLNKTN